MLLRLHPALGQVVGHRRSIVARDCDSSTGSSIGSGLEMRALVTCLETDLRRLHLVRLQRSHGFAYSLQAPQQAFSPLSIAFYFKLQ